MIFNNLIKHESDVLCLINSSFGQKSSILLTYFDQRCFNIYCSNSAYKKLIDEKFTSYLDGTGTYFASKLFGIKDIDKFNGSDLNNCLFELFTITKTKLFLIGGNFSESEIKEIRNRNQLNICGYENGYIGDDEMSVLLKNIELAKADVIIVGMGVPKQELLAYNLSKEVSVDLILCVGNFLEFYFNSKKRAPVFLRNSGFEWVFRLFTEPKRLWKRYLIGIPVFFYRIFKMKISYSKKNTSSSK
jgi:exopolysaccharide biosynthesis WecB/TagA/CpsF family protein